MVDILCVSESPSLSKFLRRHEEALLLLVPGRLPSDRRLQKWMSD